MVLFFFITSLLSAQSLAELAKKEKERRENLKGKKAIVVTNADLARLKKRPALETPVAEAAAEAGSELERREPVRATQPGSPTVTQAEDKLSELDRSSGKKDEDLKAELEEKWMKAKEYVSLLETKMNALWQEFYSLDDMTSRDSIQQQISETFLKLEKAQEEEAKLKEELDKVMARISREKAPPLWFR